VKRRQTILTGAKNLPLNIKEKRRRERNQQIEKKDNRVKIETAAKNILQTERSEKEKRALISRRF
jgi:hypothetical protein